MSLICVLSGPKGRVFGALETRNFCFGASSLKPISNWSPNKTCDSGKMGPRTTIFLSWNPEKPAFLSPEPWSPNTHWDRVLCIRIFLLVRLNGNTNSLLFLTNVINFRTPKPDTSWVQSPVTGLKTGRKKIQVNNNKWLP